MIEILRECMWEECVGSRSVGWPWKKWINTVKDCLKKQVWMSGKQRAWCMMGVNGEGV